MRRYRLDSVEMLPDGGIKVLKTTHRPLVERGPSPEDVSEAVERRLEAVGLVNATEDSGRIPLDEEAIMFAASRAPALSVDEFRPQTEAAEDLTDEG